MITGHNKVTDKYSEAVSLYATTRLSIKEICERTDNSPKAFSSYLCRNHRDLVLKRHRLDGLKKVKLRGSKGQTTAARLKYHDAIVAADSAEYLEYNISQIAALFGLTGPGLANQLRHHYPEVIPRRERERHRLGINDNVHHGVRPWCEEEYAEAVEILRATDKTVDEVAQICGVTPNGLREHIACYHQDLVKARESKRRQAQNIEKVRGSRTGSWTIHEPNKDAANKYAMALELYQTTDFSLEDIAKKQGVNNNSLRSYIRQWHPELIVERRGFDKGTKLSETKRYKKSTVKKYEAAIEYMKSCDASTLATAEKFGLNGDVFRMYLKEHEPQLAAGRGMVITKSGKRVGAKSSEKYAEALEIYANSSETLKSIAQRLDLVYISLGNYIRRNFPELIEQHNAIKTDSNKLTVGY